MACFLTPPSWLTLYVYRIKYFLQTFSLKNTYNSLLSSTRTIKSTQWPYHLQSHYISMLIYLLYPIYPYTLLIPYTFILKLITTKNNVLTPDNLYLSLHHRIYNWQSAYTENLKQLESLHIPETQHGRHFSNLMGLWEIRTPTMRLTFLLSVQIGLPNQRKCLLVNFS